MAEVMGAGQRTSCRWCWPANRLAIVRRNWFMARQLKDVAVRKRLADGGLKAIQESNDPMIQLARADRPGVAPDPPDLRAAGRRAAAPGLRQDRQCAIRRLRIECLSRRDFHAAPRVRRGEGLHGERRESSLGHDAWRHVRARRRSRQQGSIRAAENMERTEIAAQSLNAFRFREHGRHHRRQLRQPGDQSPGRTRRNHF